jgi:hypothetical protein
MISATNEAKKTDNDLWNLEYTSEKLQEVIEEVKSIGGMSSASLKSERKVIVLQC